jgi:hypothetical protein
MATEIEPQTLEEEAPMVQVAPEEDEAHEEALEEQEGSASKDGNEEGAQQGRVQ